VVGVKVFKPTRSKEKLGDLNGAQHVAGMKTWVIREENRVGRKQRNS